MNLQGKQVIVLGAGIAGLAAADELAAQEIAVTLVERSSHAGGHAIGFSCKAVDGCVKCGACMAQDRLQRIIRRPNVRMLTSAQVARVHRKERFTIDYEPCSAPLERERNRGGTGVSKPIHPGTLSGDAVLVTTGFSAYDPVEKPYGYGKFPDVVTNLDAEHILKTNSLMKRPSDGRSPERIAFIQCVGSRDSRIGHPWCSKICCGSALRMARLIQQRQPGLWVTFFYIDVQTFGKNFQDVYDQTQSRVQMVRAIPGDIFQTADQRLQVAFFDPEAEKASEEIFDMVILSVGLAPSAENDILARLLDWPLTQHGFLASHRDADTHGPQGIFTAGAAMGPMSISESIDSAGQAVSDLVAYFGKRPQV